MHYNLEWEITISSKKYYVIVHYLPVILLSIPSLFFCQKSLLSNIPKKEKIMPLSKE